jgi:hypothetical protein
MLTEQEAVPYLLQGKLLDPESIVAGTLEVVNVSRRNRNFKVISEGGPHYLLKQGVGLQGTATVAYEAAMYHYFQSDAGCGKFRRYLLCCYGYDPKEHILILELLNNAENLRDHYSRSGRFSRHLAGELGNALGLLHCLTEYAGHGNENRQGFIRSAPWILSLHHPEPSIFRDISSASIQLIRIIQQFPEFCKLLDELRLGWRAETLIHNDVKSDNCLVSSAHSASKRRQFRLKIVDWETAGIGDPCWDVGAVFSDYLSLWLFSIPITGGSPPDRFMELSRYPLEKMQPAISAFWQAYVRRMQLDDTTSSQWLLRAVKYGAARLVQTAFEQMQLSMQLMGNTVCLLQLSLNILRRPQEAIVHLLGIPLS